jgi:hypothetical protein
VLLLSICADESSKQFSSKMSDVRGGDELVKKGLLRALVKIKSNNEKVKLITIYEMDKEVHGKIFTEKNS